MNHEGYRDPTADIAVGNVEKMSNRGGTMETKVKAGEVWGTVDRSGNSIMYLIIKPFEKHSEVLKIIEEDYTGDSISVNCVGMRYVNPEMIGYCFNDKFETFIKLMRDEDMQKIKKAIAEKLGFEEIIIKEHGDAAAPEDLIDQIKAICASATVAINNGSASIAEDLSKNIRDMICATMDAAFKADGRADNYLSVKYARANAEANVYKEMYLNLLDKCVLVQKGENA